ETRRLVIGAHRQLAQFIRGFFPSGRLRRVCGKRLQAMSALVVAGNKLGVLNSHRRFVKFGVGFSSASVLLSPLGALEGAGGWKGLPRLSGDLLPVDALLQFIQFAVFFGNLIQPPVNPVGPVVL